MATRVDKCFGERSVWIECDHCGIEQPEAGNFPNRKEAEIGARRHGWKPRVKRIEGYLDLCYWCWDHEEEWRFLLMCCPGYVHPLLRDEEE